MTLAEKTFTLVEWLALTGFAQSLLILVYMLFRLSRDQIVQALLPLAYFLCFAIAFALQASLRLHAEIETIQIALWAAWALGPGLSVLLILQIAHTGALPRWPNFLILLFVPLAWVTTRILNAQTPFCGTNPLWCDRGYDWLYMLGMGAGGLALLTLFFHTGVFEKLRQGKGGKERYWLVLLLIVTNLLLLTVSLLRFSPVLDATEAEMLRSALGLAFAYLASTALFRIYPQPVQLAARKKLTTGPLSPEERDLAKRIYELMTLDKLYHEPAFSRADLARELKTPENTISRIINLAFGKSFPQLINEYRVADAKRMLDTSDIPVKTIAFEVGFNSLASFNRVFKDITGLAPSSYRNEKFED